jgi:hypothetical protein
MEFEFNFTLHVADVEGNDVVLNETALSEHKARCLRAMEAVIDMKHEQIRQQHRQRNARGEHKNRP